MKLIVGLGNPGKEYKNTRHNLGFWIIDHLADKLGVKLTEKKFNGLYYQASDYILLQPQTYMNNSGECVLAFMNYFQISLNNLLVIYDDIALSVGKFRYRNRGSAGGHNGMKNIIKLLGSENFKRLRVGIGYERNFALYNWVLGKFNQSEKEEIIIILSTLLTSLQEWISKNEFEKIMNNYNQSLIS